MFELIQLKIAPLDLLFEIRIFVWRRPNCRGKEHLHLVILRFRQTCVLGTKMLDGMGDDECDARYGLWGLHIELRSARIFDFVEG